MPNPATDQLSDPKAIRQILLPVFAEAGRVEAGPVDTALPGCAWGGKGTTPQIFPRVLFVLEGPFVCTGLEKVLRKSSCYFVNLQSLTILDPRNHQVADLPPAC